MNKNPVVQMTFKDFCGIFEVLTNAVDVSAAIRSYKFPAKLRKDILYFICECEYDNGYYITEMTLTVLSAADIMNYFARSYKFLPNEATSDE